MDNRTKKRKLATLLCAAILLSSGYGCWHGVDKYNAYAGSAQDTKDYFLEGFGTGADFSKDSWNMKTTFGQGTALRITEDPDNQAGIVENEHSGNQEKILRLINARSLDLNSSEKNGWARVSTAMVGDRISLKESKEFSVKFTISMPDACINKNLADTAPYAGEVGGDGIAFIMTPDSTFQGNINTGMGYYGLRDGMAIELDSFFHGAYCDLESSGSDYVNWAYDNQIFANAGLGYLQAVADDTRNKGIDYNWIASGSYTDYLKGWGYSSLPIHSDRRFDHVGVMLEGDARVHQGISYLNGLKPDFVESGKYLNLNDPSASTPSESSSCDTRFAEEGNIEILGEDVDNRLFTVWVEYDGYNLYVRYANGSFSEAVRPEESQIILEENPILGQKFVNEDVYIGFVSSISDTGSAASHTVHSVAFVNTFFEDGIPAGYLENQKVEAAKEVIQGALDGVEVRNDTTRKNIQDSVDTALSDAEIKDVTVTVEDFTKTDATTNAEGRIETVISFECGSIRDSISITKTIEKLPATKPTGKPTETPLPPTETPTDTQTPPSGTPTGKPTETQVPPTESPTALPTDTPVPPRGTPTSPSTGGVPTEKPAGLYPGKTLPPSATNAPAKAKVTIGSEYRNKRTKAIYWVTGTGKTRTAAYQRSTSKSVRKVTVPSIVSIQGKTYRVTSIGDSAFAGNNKLVEVTIGKNIKSIGKKAFYGCKKLEKVKIGKNVTIIKENAFRKCTSLKLVTIPKKVKKIGDYAFRDCKKLKYIEAKTNRLQRKTVGKGAFVGGYRNPRVKTSKKVSRKYADIFVLRGLSKRGIFVIPPVDLVI